MLGYLVGGVRRRLARASKKLIYPLEWNASRRLLGRAPWCRNRFGQWYQPLSFPEYRYMRNGNPEVLESLFLESVLTSGMNVVDVGANHGLFTLEASFLVGPTGHVHSFEPAPTTYDQLLKHLEVNSIRNVKTYPAAVGGSSGEASLRVHTAFTGLNSLADHDQLWDGRVLKADQIVRVPLVRLDDFAKDNRIDRIDFLKVDVEGFELGVIQGARELLSTNRIGWIQIEIDTKTTRNAGTTPRELIEAIEELGYSVFRLAPGGKVGSRCRASDSFELGGNYVAASKSAPSAEERQA